MSLHFCVKRLIVRDFKNKKIKPSSWVGHGCCDNTMIMTLQKINLNLVILMLVIALHLENIKSQRELIVVGV